MARIIYGVAGQGFGHSSRSHLIGQRLLEAGHEVMFAASRRSLSYLSQYFGHRVKEVFGLRLLYRNGCLNPVKTVAGNIVEFFKHGYVNRRLYRKHFEPFAPDLVISDFEPFTARWALKNKVPYVSIDHQHLLTLCELDHVPDHWLPRVNAEVVTAWHYSGAAAYVILNFFRATTRHAAAVLAPPVVRPAVESSEPSCKEHVTLYTTDTTWKEGLLEILAAFPRQRFHVYGFDEDRQHGNCILKRTSTEGFVQDLASSKGVIATAGFSLISECLHLRKRMLLIPLDGQYEQMINAQYVQKLGLGLYTHKLDRDALDRFLASLKQPLADDQQVLWPSNETFFRLLERTFESVGCAARV